MSGPRPCPWVACKHHLFLDVKPNGTIAYPRGKDMEGLERMERSCALDEADRGGMHQSQVGEAINVSMQMASLIEIAALGKLSCQSELEDHSR